MEGLFGALGFGIGVAIGTGVTRAASVVIRPLLAGFGTPGASAVVSVPDPAPAAPGDSAGPSGSPRPRAHRRSKRDDDADARRIAITQE